MDASSQAAYLLHTLAASVLRLFSVLRVMLNSSLGSVMNLCWSMVMLFVHLLHLQSCLRSGRWQLSATTGDSLDDAERENLPSVFGSVEVAMRTSSSPAPVVQIGRCFTV